MPPSDSYKNRWLSNRRTPANGADPRHVVILQRSRSPLLYSWHLNWDEVAPGSFTRASAAMRQEAASRPATEAFVGGIDTSGAKIYSAPISVNGPGTWALVDSYAGALDVALAFGGGMVPLPRYRTGFVTEGEPWAFIVTAAGALIARRLDGETVDETIAAANVTRVSAVMGVTSRYRDITQGLLVFYVLSTGGVYYKALIDGVWEGPSEVADAPASPVDIGAGRTWDYRIWLHISDAAGAVYEVMSKMAISANANLEYLTAAVSTTIDVYEVTYNDLQSPDEYITASLGAEVTVLWGLAPVLLAVANLDDGAGNWGLKVKLDFDADLYSVAGNDTAFQLIDASSFGFDCTAIAQESARRLVLPVAEFNNAVNPIRLVYTPGTLIGDVELVAAIDQAFTASGLVPTYTDPPVPQSAANIIDWEAVQ